MSQPIQDDDWRLMGQERFLSGATLYWRIWRETRPGWDHDHCAFCGVKFMVHDGPEILRVGYTTADEYYWLCERCAKDFAERFGFTLIGRPDESH